MAAPGADVRSIPALRDWLGAMTVYRDAAADAVSGINQEIRRGYDWIDQQTSLWQRAVRQCEEEVTQAKAELAARKFPGWDGKMPDTTLQERNLRRAKARLEYAEEKAATCRKWAAALPKQVEETYSGSASGPSASRTRSPSRPVPTSAIRPSCTATSAANPGVPVPSTTVPPLITSS